MKIDIVVMRHRAPGAPHFLSHHLEAVIVNAGDGAHEHPTQALLSWPFSHSATYLFLDRDILGSSTVHPQKQLVKQ